MRNLLVFFIGIILLVSCSETKKELSSETIIIKALESNNCNILKYSEVFDDIEFVRLENGDDCVIGNIDQIIFYKNRFYILDTYIAKSVFIFDKDGYFIDRIGALGNGPGEYTRPDYMDINFFSDLILIYDSFKKFIIAYDLDGDYKYSIRLENRIDAFATLDKDKYAIYFNYYGNEEIKTLPKHNLFIINEKGDILHKEFARIKSKIPNNSSLNWFCRLENNLLFSPSFDNKIYLITDKAIAIKYEIDLGENLLTETDIIKIVNKENSKKAIYERIENSNLAYLNGFFETLNHFVFNISYKKRTHSVFYSKKTGDIKYSTIFLNDMYGLIPGSQRVYGGLSEDNMIITSFTPSVIPLDYYKELMFMSIKDKEYYKNEFLKNIPDEIECSKEMRRIIKSIKHEITDVEVNFINEITQNCNPILIKMKLKNF